MDARNSIHLDDPLAIAGSRVLDAPRELVWKVWTDPKHLAQWWGPDGFRTTTSAYECKPGGVWRFVMHGPDGRDYENRITFDEIVKPERIVYRHGGGGDVEPVQFTTTVTFEELGGKTRLHVQSVETDGSPRDFYTTVATVVGPDLVPRQVALDQVAPGVYEQDLGAVTKGAVVNVHVPAYPGESFSGTVSHVGDVLDPATHTVKIRCVVPNPGNRLKPEMFARVELTNAGDIKAILLPSRAILTDSQHARVIVATEDNVYRQRVVETGPEVDGNVRVLAGIRPGEKVVTDGAIFLRREMESD